MPADAATPPLPLPTGAVSAQPGRRALCIGAAVCAAAVAVKMLAAPRSDSIPPDEGARRRTALAAAMPLRLPTIAPADLDAALRSLALAADQRLELRAAIAARGMRMAVLEVFDSDAEDGDVIRIEALGLAQTVRLTKRPVAVPVLLPSDGRIRIIGVDEGLGGGVTAGVISGGRALKLPPLAVGESLVVTAAATP